MAKQSYNINRPVAAVVRLGDSQYSSTGSVVGNWEARESETARHTPTHLHLARHGPHVKELIMLAGSCN